MKWLNYKVFGLLLLALSVTSFICYLRWPAFYPTLDGYALGIWVTHIAFAVCGVILTWRGIDDD